MLTIVCDTPGSLSAIERDKPVPAAGEALVRIRRVGVCGTDLHVHDGSFFAAFPLTPGHEPVGIVDAIGEDVEGFELGQRIVATGVGGCGRCENCRRGRPLLKEDIAALRDLAKLLNRPENRKNLGQLLDRMPETMDDQTRTGTYGSWYQYYICGVSATIKLPIIGEQALLKQITKYIENFSFKSTAPRCQDH